MMRMTVMTERRLMTVAMISGMASLLLMNCGRTLLDGARINSAICVIYPPITLRSCIGWVRGVLICNFNTNIDSLSIDVTITRNLVVKELPIDKEA